MSLPARRQHAPAVDAGQHHVQYGKVVAFGQRKVQTVYPITRQIHAKASLGQPLFQVVAGFLFVLDDEDFHHSPSSWVKSRLFRWGAERFCQVEKY